MGLGIPDGFRLIGIAAGEKLWWCGGGSNGLRGDGGKPQISDRRRTEKPNHSRKSPVWVVLPTGWYLIEDGDPHS